MIEVLNFISMSCMVCKTLQTNLKEIKDIIDIDISKNTKAVKENKIRDIPTIVFKLNGKEIHREMGIISKNKYDNLIMEIENDIKWDKQ